MVLSEEQDRPRGTSPPPKTLPPHPVAPRAPGKERPIHLATVGRHQLSAEIGLRAWEGVEGVQVIDVLQTEEDVVRYLTQGGGAEILLVAFETWSRVYASLSAHPSLQLGATPAVILIGPDDARSCHQALRLNAAAYVPLSSGFAEFVKIVRTVAAGYVAYPRHLLGPLATIPEGAWWEAFESTHAGVLSKRQLEVARLVALGFTDREIALKLDLSPRTIEGLVSTTLARLDLDSRLQMALLVRTGSPTPHA